MGPVHSLHAGCVEWYLDRMVVKGTPEFMGGFKCAYCIALSEIVVMIIYRR